MTDFIADLEAIFWGNPDGKYAVLKSYKDAGVDLAAVLSAVQSGGVGGGGGPALRNGTSDPSGALGADGDFYINTTTHTLFGPKAAGVWPAGVSLVGPAGAAGSNGAGVATGGTAKQVLAKNSGTNFDTGWTGSLQLTTLGVGQALTNAHVIEAVDASTESTATSHNVIRVNDNRTFGADQTNKGIGGKSSGLWLDVPVTVGAGHTADYAGVTVNALAFSGAGSFGVVSAYEMHFDVQNTGDPTATQQNGLATHLGVLNGGAGIIQDQQSFYVGAMNAAGPTTTLAANVAVGDTTISLTDGTQLAGKGPYFVITDHPQGRSELNIGEIVKATAGIGTNTLTVQRAQGGTVATSHISGLQVAACAIANATGLVLDETASLSAARTYGFRIRDVYSQHMGPVGVGGSTTYDLPKARLDVHEKNANQDVLKLSTKASSGVSDVVRRTVMNQINTTAGTTVQLFAVDLTATGAGTVLVDLTIYWHRTGGTAGAANDGGAMRYVFPLKFDGSTVTNLGTTKLYNVGSQVIADPTLGGLVFGLQQINITPPANNNITWHVIAEVSSVNN